MEDYYYEDCEDTIYQPGDLHGFTSPLAGFLVLCRKLSAGLLKREVRLRKPDVQETVEGDPTPVSVWCERQHKTKAL